MRIGVYNQEAGVDIHLRVKVRRLFGWMQSEQRIATVKIGMVIKDYLVTPMYPTSPSIIGKWDEWINFNFGISQIPFDLALMSIIYDDGIDVYAVNYPIVEDGNLKQGYYKVLLNGRGGNDSNVEKVLKMAEEGNDWPKVDWLDTLTFAHLSKLQLSDAIAKHETYLIIEFCKFDAKISIDRPSELVCRAEEISLQQVDCRLKPPKSLHLAPGPEHIRPSARSLPIIKRLSREPCFDLPAAAPAVLWKYRDWLANESILYLPLFIKSVDWVDMEEVEIARNIIHKWSTELDMIMQTNLLASLLALSSNSPELYCFDPDICMILTGCVPTLYECDVYICCQYLKWPSCNYIQTNNYLCQALINSCHQTIYAAQSVHWLMHKPEWLSAEMKAIMERQLQLIDAIQIVIGKVRMANRLNRLQKISLLCNLLSDNHEIFTLTSACTPLPTEPSIFISGIIPERSIVYKSTAMPVKISFLGNDCSEHSVIIKTDENLEGDLMVMKLIKLIGEVVWKDKLPCLSSCLLTYSILPVKNHGGGWLGYVKSVSLSSILADYGNSISLYLASLDGDALSNYIHSCAAYSLTTYILGVGDRHLENLLLAENGCLFHVDYAYLFGADPKPFPPPMKLCKEMVEAMGGINSGEFKKFKKLVLRGFQLLRIHAALILNFLSLHRHLVGMEQIKFVRDRLALDAEDADALKAMERLVDESVNAMFAQVIDTIHKWAQYWRV